MSATNLSRRSRLWQGWSANGFQMLLGVGQQVVLIPIFLHFWTSATLAAWLTIYAAGNLILISDCGLHVHAINRFLAFRSGVDCDGRSANFYRAMMRVYLMLTAALVVLVLAAILIFPPAASLGFVAIPQFNLAFGTMSVGVLLTVPANLAVALYRARGHYGRAVRLQCLAMLLMQLSQLAVIAWSGSLLAVVLAYVLVQIAVALYVVVVDAPHLFPFLRGACVGERSPRWAMEQFRMALPFGAAGATELALANAPVLLVGTLVSDHVAIAQWGLTRVVAGLLRALCVQATLPLAAELGRDYAIGAKDQLRSLYARGSMLICLLAAVVASGLLAFWSDFFALWTRGAVPYDPLLTATLMVGTVVASPSILATSYANFSGRGTLLALIKSLQLGLFLLLSLSLIPSLGPLGAALAVVCSDMLFPLGWLTVDIMRQTLKRPVRHIAVLAASIAVITPAGWGLGGMIRWAMPGTGLVHFVTECGLWLLIVASAGSFLLNDSLREKLAAAIPG